MHLISTLLFVFLPKLWAYPEFIGYGYKACLTCHMNGHGSGPLNDYGRGLWASEIAASSLYSKGTTLDQMSEKSGFFGKTEMPYWIRPHLKYRAIQILSNIRGDGEKWSYYPMQLDIGATVFADTDNRYGFIYTAGYVPNAETSATKKMTRILPKDYYFRLNLVEPFWLYIGKMDKVFGLRNIDHTSYQRAPQGLAQNSQTLAVTGHYVQETYELTAQVFNGNPQTSNALREQKGASLMGEFDTLGGRVGLSALSSKSDLNESYGIASTHFKMGLSHGSALEFEFGILQTKSANTTFNGSYSFAQSMILLGKGYNLLTTIERYNLDVASTASEQWKLGLGLVMWPINRVEARLGTVLQRSVSSTTASDDQWVVQGQMHVSL
jgi:hypothetical protein